MHLWVISLGFALFSSQMEAEKLLLLLTTQTQRGHLLINATTLMSFSRQQKRIVEQRKETRKSGGKHEMNQKKKQKTQKYIYITHKKCKTSSIINSVQRTHTEAEPVWLTRCVESSSKRMKKWPCFDMNRKLSTTSLSQSLSDHFLPAPPLQFHTSA